MSEAGLDRSEVTEAAADRWIEHANQTVEMLLVAENSWFIGTNTPGKASNYLLYGGDYRPGASGPVKSPRRA